MTVILVTFGGTGDVHPTVALGQALYRRGHQVCFISNPYFEPLARAIGLEFIGFGSAEQFTDRMRGTGARSLKKRFVRSLVSMSWASQGIARWRLRGQSVVGPMRWLYEFIRARYVPGETIVAARANNFGARIAQEKLGVPLVTIHVQPAMIRSVYEAPGFPLPDGDGPLLRALRRMFWAFIDAYADRLVLPETNAFRFELGLAPVRRPFSRWVHSPELLIGLFPEWFAGVQPDWPPNTHLVGFPMFDQAGLKEVPSEVETFFAAGEPPIVFTSGSVFRHISRFFDVAVRACQKLKKRGLLLSPASEFVPRDLPETVRHFEYVPLSSVLPQSAGIVHHGGIGTAALAFAAGVPQLVVPFVDDQFDNAVRIQRLGTGLKMSHHSFQPKIVAKKLEFLLGSEAVGRSCRSIMARVRQQDPLSEACRLIEELNARCAES